MALNPHKYGSIEYETWDYEHPEYRAEQIDPVWQAKNWLKSQESRETKPDKDVADRLNSIAPERSHNSKPRGALRGLTENAADFGQVLGLAALPGIVPSPYTPVAAALGLGSSMAQAPDYIRRLIPGLREAGEEAPGLVESALTVGPAAIAGSKSLLRGGAAALKGLKGLSRGAGLVDEAANLGGRALAYEGAPLPMRPWPKPSNAAPAIDELLETQSFKGLPRGAVSKTKPTPYTSPEYEAELGRALRGDAPPFSETGTHVPGEIYHPSTDVSGKWRSYRSGAPTPQESTFAPGSDWENIELPAALDPMQKLAARSAERFGKRFRKE